MPAPRRRGPSSLRLVALGGLLAALFVATRSGCEDQAATTGAGDAFFARLRAGDVHGAHALLSARRRAALSEARFAELVDHDAFRSSTGVSVTDIESPDGVGGGTCTYGTLRAGSSAWTYQLFLVEDPDGARVESFAIQAPASPALGVLLEECGYWEGTTVGYGGPGIERSTRPLP